jgi:hypothetical protein
VSSGSTVYINQSTTSTSQVVTGLPANTGYLVQVYASNSSGNSGITSNGAQTYALPPTALAASNITSTSFTANWTQPTGATGYRIDVGTSQGGTQIFSNFVGGGGTTSYVVNSVAPSLNPNTTYWYQVHTQNPEGTSPEVSNSMSVVTAPGIPGISGRTTATTNSITFAWTAPPGGASGYYLDVSTDPAFGSYIVGNGSNSLDVGNVLTYTITGVTSGTNYYYRVRAYNSTGVSASTSSTLIDTAPVLISLTAGTSSSDHSPVVINTGVSLNGGPYVRSATPFLTATFSDQVTGVQYSIANQGIVLQNSAGVIQSLASPYNPVNNTTPTTGSAGNPSTATFQPLNTLSTTSCASSKYSVTLSGGTTATTIHDTGIVPVAMTSAGPYYFTVDTISPTVSSVTPANNATAVSLTQAITIVFTENCSMNPLTFTPANIQLTNNTTGALIPITISESASPFTTLTITPASLEFSTTYTLTLSNIADAAGNLLIGNIGTAGSYTTVFTTSAESASNFAIIPSFLSSPVPPNVLIILDNSNSMDETLTTGDAIGSFNCTNPNDSNTCSRSVLARQALINLINSYANKLNIGLMSYSVPNNTSNSWYVYDNFYFVSYDPRTYCGIKPPPASCYNYCTQENPQSFPGTDYGVGVAGVDYTPDTYEADCNSACRTGHTLSSPVINYTGIFNSNFQANIREQIINGTSDSNGSAINGAKRQTYCANIYPKTVAYNYNDLAGDIGTLYHSIVGTFYDGNPNDGIGFVDAQGDYTTDENHYNSCYYYEYSYKATPTTYPYDIGYNNQFGGGNFAGTDDDLANGFLNYGQSQMWYPPYNGNAAPTWSANPYNYDQLGGFLHVPALINTPADNNQLNALLNKLGPNGFKNDAPGYMSCGNSGDNANRCSYIVNAGATPTASTLQDAINYFNGGISAAKTQANSTPASPITNGCQKTFVIYVTDGLPSVDGNGSPLDATSLVTGKDVSGNPVTVAGGTVLDKINSLRCTNPPIPPALPVAGTCGVSNTIAGATTNPVYSDVQTYVLGLALTPLAGVLLDQMAVAGNTADANGHAYYANDPTSLNNALVTIFQNILSQLSAGTAASILNNSQGSGANMLQAVFYPTKTFDSNTQCGWIGEIQNLWYYVDPTLQNSSTMN